LEITGSRAFASDNPPLLTVMGFGENVLLLLFWLERAKGINVTISVVIVVNVTY